MKRVSREQVPELPENTVFRVTWDDRNGYAGTAHWLRQEGGACLIVSSEGLLVADGHEVDDDNDNWVESARFYRFDEDTEARFMALAALNFDLFLEELLKEIKK